MQGFYIPFVSRANVVEESFRDNCGMPGVGRRRPDRNSKKNQARLGKFQCRGVRRRKNPSARCWSFKSQRNGPTRQKTRGLRGWHEYKKQLSGARPESDHKLQPIFDRRRHRHHVAPAVMEWFVEPRFNSS
jgi:hypothetical protein